MIDLTKITEPFGLLDAKTQAALQTHGGPYEVFTGEDFVATTARPLFANSLTYRVKPQPLTKPSVDWSIFGPEVVAIARDASGYGYAYTDRPVPAVDMWDGGCYECSRLDGFIASYTPGTCDWRDSLVMRPEGV